MTPLSEIAAQDSVEIVPVVDQKTNSPKESLRLQIFKDAPGKAACVSVQVDPRGSTQGLEPGLDEILQKITRAVKAKDDKALQPLFHERLNVGLGAINTTYARLDQVYGAPFDISVYRLWALNTVDGSPAPLACQDDRLQVTPQYGYPLQFAAWLQIMGQKELGRIFVSIVPANGRWSIGAFHAQQWTHATKDFATWTEDAIKTARMGFKEAAFVKYDIAAKLLDGGGFLSIAMRDDVIIARDAAMKPETWGQALKDQLPGRDVAYSSSLLVVDGSGILLRLRVPKELSMEAIKADCAEVARTLLKQPWAAHVEGIRCSYLLPPEDAKSDGAMGGIFVAFDELEEKP